MLFALQKAAQQPVMRPPRVLDELTDWLGLGDRELTGKLLQALIIVLAAWGAIWVLRYFARRVERVAHGHGHGVSRGETLARLIQSVGAAVIAVAAFLMAASLFFNITPLLTTVGIAGLAVSFGAQSLVKDVIAGFFILLENQYQLGDSVRIAGVEGTVSHLTLRATVLRDGSGVVHFIPNGQIAVVSNLTRTWSRAVVDVGVAYGSDIDKVTSVLRTIIADLAKDPSWSPRLTGESAVSGIQQLGDSAVTIRAWVNTQPGTQGDVKSELLRRIKSTFEREGIEMPYPQHVVHVVNERAAT
ncbi:MAG TPA: mechanosensitive ion channel family protein [Gemmatimonadales bacterium]|nr:mechanosensitive ion channel family protein [Gemmatimonadales bacterium]